MQSTSPHNKGVCIKMTRTVNGKTTLPLNGWRARTLTQYYFGEADASLLDEADKMIIPAKVLQELPAWDKAHTEYVNSFEGDVIITVEEEEPSYGYHISVEKAPSILEMNRDLRWGRWADYIRVSVSRSLIRIYWRSVRPEDFIMHIRTEDIKDAMKLIDQRELCQHYWCENDLVFRVVQMYGAELQKLIDKAGVM